MKLFLVTILACIATAVSACVVEPFGAARVYHPRDQRTSQYFQPDQEHVWRR